MPQLQHGLMHERITLFSVTGNRVEQVIKRVSAKVRISGAGESFRLGQQAAETQLKAWIYYRTDIAPQDRLRRPDGTEWEITAVIDSGLPRWPRFETEITATRMLS